MSVVDAHKPVKLVAARPRRTFSRRDADPTVQPGYWKAVDDMLHELDESFGVDAAAVVTRRARARSGWLPSPLYIACAKHRLNQLRYEFMKGLPGPSSTNRGSSARMPARPTRYNGFGRGLHALLASEPCDVDRDGEGGER